MTITIKHLDTAIDPNPIDLRILALFVMLLYFSRVDVHT
jgi:hypothetical protein